MYVVIGVGDRAGTAHNLYPSMSMSKCTHARDDTDGHLVVEGPVEAQNVVNQHFKPLLRWAVLPPIRFHDLRHSCLSLLAQRGEPIRDLQALAGHATAAFTLGRYTHHYDSSARRTASAMDEALSE